MSEGTEAVDRGGRWIGAVLAVVMAAVLAVVPTFWGYGVVGHRAIFYEPGELYIYHGEEAELEVEVDGRARGMVGPDSAQIFELIGGTTTLVMGPPEEEWTLEVDGNAFFAHFSDQCVAIGRDVEGWEEGEIAIGSVELSDSEERLHRLASSEIIWPRGYPGAVEWGTEAEVIVVDFVECSLLDDPSFVREYMGLRLEERMGD